MNAVKIKEVRTSTKSTNLEQLNRLKLVDDSNTFYRSTPRMSTKVFCAHISTASTQIFGGKPL